MKKNLTFRKKIISVKDRAGKDKFYKLNSFKLRNKIGWKPKIDLSSGIDTVYEWLKNNENKIKNRKLSYVHKK